MCQRDRFRNLIAFNATTLTLNEDALFDRSSDDINGQ